jgi:uncharacterized protein (UPF0218 family)
MIKRQQGQLYQGSVRKVKKFQNVEPFDEVGDLVKRKCPDVSAHSVGNGANVVDDGAGKEGKERGHD